jgi:mono/diheme cytochrome c family protein
VTRAALLAAAGLCAASALGAAQVRPEGLQPRTASGVQAGGAADAERYSEVFARYCVSCHSDAQKTRGTVPVAFESLDLAKVGADAAMWERVVRKVRAGVMPPAGMPRPDRATLDGLAGWLEGRLDLAAAANPNPGRTESLHRLNRSEYRNAIRDLLGLDLDVSPLLPPDDSSYGFDNIAGVLKLSPTLMERYLSAAQKVSRLAVGAAGPTPAIDYFRVIDDLSQDRHVEGLPLGTRGGTRVAYVFPMDGEYEFRPRLARDLNEQLPLYGDDQIVEVSIDGVRAGVFTLAGIGRGEDPARPAAAAGGAQRPAISQIATGPRLSAKEREARNRADETWNLRVPVKAGQRDVVITFLNRTTALDESPRLPFLRPYPAGVNIPETRLGAHLRSVEIEGPLNPTGPGATPVREALFACRPPSPAAAPGGASAPLRRDDPATAAESACARRILTSLATRAYRRPVRAADVAPLLEFYREGREGATFDRGIERAVRRLLVSPEFLFRVERDPAGVKPGEPYRVADLDLASRLSFFLWSSIPDDELIAVAARGELGRPATLDRQVRRMLASPKAGAFVRNFSGQWLFLRNLDASAPVQSVFPDFDDALRQGFRRETELFVESVLREDRSALDLLRADYTFLNERLARHYGIPNVAGSHFRRVTLPAGNPRRGLLGQGSILTVTSYPDRTSPVVRGKWILENLLGTPPPPPVPNVPPLKATGAAGTVLSMRQRMEQHRASPVCASCHAMMDPLGLSLENFDAVGKWRTLGESSSAIDVSGRLPDGTPFEGAAGLREALLRSDLFVTTLTEKMLTYALGRGLEHYDAPAVRTIVRDAAKQDYRLSSIVAGVAKSAPFRTRRAADAGASAAAQTN